MPHSNGESPAVRNDPGWYIGPIHMGQSTICTLTNVSLLPVHTAAFKLPWVHENKETLQRPFNQRDWAVQALAALPPRGRMDFSPSTPTLLHPSVLWPSKVRSSSPLWPAIVDEFASRTNRWTVSEWANSRTHYNPSRNDLISYNKTT